jgi:hypothetical protein
MAKSRRLSYIARISTALIVILLIILVISVYREGKCLWIVSYLKWEFSTPIDREAINLPRDIVLAIVAGISAGESESLSTPIIDSINALCARYIDNDSQQFKLTMFAESDSSLLRRLSYLSEAGACEVEYMLNPKSGVDSVIDRKIATEIGLLNKFGWGVTTQREVSFAVMRVDGGSRPASCDRNELEILRGAGCYADLTCASRRSMDQWSLMNTVAMLQPKLNSMNSRNSARELVAGKLGRGSVLTVNSPLVIAFRRGKWYRPYLDDGILSVPEHPDPARVDSWIRANVHVRGQPNWLFIKIEIADFVETMSDRVFLQSLNEMLSFFGYAYGDGVRYRLHFASARETYNIARAAEAGREGDAGEYRDYMIKQYMSIAKWSGGR